MGRLYIYLHLPLKINHLCRYIYIRPMDPGHVPTCAYHQQVFPPELQHIPPPFQLRENIGCPYVPWSKVAILGMVIPPFDRNPYNGYINLNPYYWVDDHPLLYGNNGSLDPGTYDLFQKKTCQIGQEKWPRTTPLCSLLPSPSGFGMSLGYLNTEPNRVFGALGTWFWSGIPIIYRQSTFNPLTANIK